MYVSMWNLGFWKIYVVNIANKVFIICLGKNVEKEEANNWLLRRYK